MSTGPPTRSPLTTESTTALTRPRATETLSSRLNRLVQCSTALRSAPETLRVSMPASIWARYACERACACRFSAIRRW